MVRYDFRKSAMKKAKGGKSSMDIRHDSIGGGHHGHGHGHDQGHSHSSKKPAHLTSLTYLTDESDAWRAHLAAEHHLHRGKFWNQGKHDSLTRYTFIFLVAIFQAMIAYGTNVGTNVFITSKYAIAGSLLKEDKVILAFLAFFLIQLGFALAASLFVWIEPVSAGSGIPEVKCFLNGVDVPRVGHVKTLICKVLGVTCSVAAGLPVGKEGPMVHSGAVVAATLSSGRTKNDREKRDLVACGAAAGVCTAFSAPIGGILFALEEGASYWGPSLTWRTFFCCMFALATLYNLDTLGSALGKQGVNKMFSFGAFENEDGQSSYAVYELFVFMVIGSIGGLIGAVFNNTNEHLTIWRMKNVNHSKSRRLIEVLCVSTLVTVISFGLPLLWDQCTPLPEGDGMTEQQLELLQDLVPFGCEEGKEYNEVASLIFTDAGAAIKQLFHLHRHAFSDAALFMFFFSYISLAVLVYGIAVPSGLFVPSLLSGAAFGRLFGNLLHKVVPGLAYSNTYALIGAAAVLGGMARMTISLTVILLECTGNEQFVLPLMLTLMTARLIGGLFNDDLYHIHIHLKKGIDFLESELRSIPRHFNLTAREIMGEHIVYVRPIETAGAIYDILKASHHHNFPVVDKDDNGVLFGTIGRDALSILLKQRAWAKLGEHPQFDREDLMVNEQRYVPMVQWHEVERNYTNFPTLAEMRPRSFERDCLIDLRPYANTAPITIQEASSVSRTYELFRSLGLRFLPVVNRHNHIVGTISRADLTAHSLAEVMMNKGKKNK